MAYDTDKGQGTLEDILFERIYRVALTGDMKLCDPLNMPIVYAGISHPGSFWCKDLYLDAAAALMLVKRSPAFDGVCAAWSTMSYPRMSAEEAAAGCKVIRDNLENPRVLCDKMIPRWMSEESRPGCVAEYSRYTRFDDPNVCDAFKGEPDSLVLRCDDYARLARAEHAKDPKLCGDSEICRLLTGTGKDLPGKYEEHVRAAFCGAKADERQARSAADANRASALVDSAFSDLFRAEDLAAGRDRELTRRVDGLAETLSRLKLKLDAGANLHASVAP